MQLELTDAVSAAMIDDDLVFLDIDADAYFCLPLPPGLARVSGAALETPDAQLGEELIAAGLARHPMQAQALTKSAPPLPPRVTARRLIEQTPALTARMRLSHVRATIAAIREGLASRRRTFREIVNSGPASLTPAPLDRTRLLADLAVWRRIVPWLPMDGVCLFRSGMLSAFLRALGHRPIWVFGVRTWPFQAHCWLQVDDIALDDEAERLRAFTPILAI